MISSGSTVQEHSQPLLKRYRDLLIVLACAVGFRLAFAALTSNTYDYDEFVLLLLSRDYAHGAVPYRDFMFFHPPGALVPLRLAQPLISIWWPAARLLTLMVDTATAALVWRIGTLLYDRKTALAAGILYGLSPLALISAVRVGQDPLLTALGMAGLVVLLSTQSQKGACAAGVCLGLAIWIKYPAAIFLPVYLFASPRRALSSLLGVCVGAGAAFAPFLAQAHQMYAQTVTFQRTRWTMDLGQRLETAGLYWLLVNVFAVVGILRGLFTARPGLLEARSLRGRVWERGRPPVWLLAGFGLGGLFLLSSQVYYHYFVPIVPFAAVLGAPVAIRLAQVAPRLVTLAAIAVVGGWAATIDLAGASPLFVTAAHLSDIRPTIELIDRRTRADGRVLADRYEYAYLAQRPTLAHYFWNVGVLVDAGYLERRVSAARAVVLSYGASSGYPAGFTRYLNARYASVRTKANTVWLVSRRAETQ